MYRLYLFESDESVERVVISDLPQEQVEAEYGDAIDVVDILGDAQGFPCDCTLTEI